MNIISLFSGAGGMDSGFEQAGFNVIWANEYDKHIWATYKHNFPDTHLDQRSITNIPVEEVPETEGIIGGPPCQSWSGGGTGKGIEDKRGQLFDDYIRILHAKQPKFFLVENVAGILQPKHRVSFNRFLIDFQAAGYQVTWKLLDANDYNVPENRLRVIIIGIRNDLDIEFIFPESPNQENTTLEDAIGDINQQPLGTKNKSNSELELTNHEYLIESYSSQFMSRNRVRRWDQPSFTIPASGRHVPLHPQAPMMARLDADHWMFAPGQEELYRRLSVREAARVQTFPDTHQFIYHNILQGYKMVGNAVPVNLAFHLAQSIKNTLEDNSSSYS